MAKVCTVHASDVMREVTLTVSLKGIRVAKLRIWLGSKLILLATMIMGCNIKLERD